MVQPGEVIKIEKIEGKATGEKVIFDEVLLVEENEKVEIGAPLIKKAKVTGKVLVEGKEKKIIIFKYKAKARQRVKSGHRQQFIKVEIEKIEG